MKPLEFVHYKAFMHKKIVDRISKAMNTAIGDIYW